MRSKIKFILPIGIYSCSKLSKDSLLEVYINNWDDEEYKFHNPIIIDLWDFEEEVEGVNYYRYYDTVSFSYFEDISTNLHDYHKFPKGNHYHIMYDRLKESKLTYKEKLDKILDICGRGNKSILKERIIEIINEE